MKKDNAEAAYTGKSDERKEVPQKQANATAAPHVDWGTGRVTDAGGRDAMARPESVPLQPQEGTAGQSPTPQVQPSRRLTYEEMFRQLNPYKPPTPEELEKERKKQRREQIFAAIGDGISALSNLYFTTQYAPNMYSGRNTASQRVKDRWDKLAADRNANMTAYINGLMRARQADDAYNDNERKWARQLGLDKIKQERDKAADARAEAKEARDEEMHELDKQLMDGKITEQQHKAGKAAVEEKYAPALSESQVEQRRASASASRANAAASRERAAKIRTDRRAGGKTITLQMPDGSTESVHIPKENWNEANITKLYWLLGGKPEVDDGLGRTSQHGRRNSGKRAPTTEEMEQFIGRNLQVGNATIKNMDEALEYLEGLQADE